MFKVVWKSFKYNRKNFLSFFMSEILSVAVIFMLIYIQEALSQVPGIKTEALQFAYQSELRKQLRIIIPCIILIMILVTGYSVKAYINTRIWDYKLFQLLGIRKKNLKVMIGLEYVISGMLAFIRCERNIQRHVVVLFTCDRYKWNVLRRIYKILLLRNNGNCFDTKGSCNVRMDFMHIWNYFYDIYYFFNQTFMERNFKNMG